jgi:hypothetical protein
MVERIRKTLERPMRKMARSIARIKPKITVNAESEMVHTTPCRKSFQYSRAFWKPWIVSM